MKRPIRALLERALAGELSPAEEIQVGRLLEQQPALRTWMEEQRALETTVRRTVYRYAEQTVDPYFSARVLAVLEARPPLDLAAALAPLFKPIVAVGALLVAALLAYNMVQVPPYEAEQTVFERALALPPATPTTADEFAFIVEQSINENP